MTTYLTRPRAVVAVALIAAVAAVGAYAFTASNTVPATNAGSGTSTVSGYAVTNIAYNLTASDPTTVDTITFHLDKAASDVKILTSGTTYFDCGASGASTPWLVTCDYTANSGTPIALSGITKLDVVALG